MIHFDKEHKQILTSACIHCKDDCFQPPSNQVPKVGCCSYSPTFYLLEIRNMVITDEAFFQTYLLDHPSSQIEPYSIKMPAIIHPTYDSRQINGDLSKLEQDDLRQSYSICQFFKTNHGCILHPSYKNSVCRSFICLSIEDHLAEEKKGSLLSWTKEIKTEELRFQKTHETVLQDIGINLQSNPLAVIQYLQSI